MFVEVDLGIRKNQEAWPSIVPAHVAIIMDGNGRWAKALGKIRSYGHAQGAKRAIDILQHAARRGISMLTLFTLSQENLLRPQEEVSALLHLLESHLLAEKQRLMDADICIRFMGDLSVLPSTLRELVDEVAELSSRNRGLVVNIALNYSGKWHLCKAAEALLSSDKSDKEVSLDRFEWAMNEALGFSIPAIDLLIRTGEEQRISNFMLWHLAYSELYFPQTAWPDFSNTHFDEALHAFSTRERRYGLVEEAVS